MAAIPQSPAVVVLEKDNSSYPPNIESSIVGIVGYASKGPTDKPTLITSQENLVNTFGPPSERIVGQGLEGALEILETTNQIRYVRAKPSDAKDASALVPLGVCPAVKFAPSGLGLTRSVYFKISVSDCDSTPIITDKTFTVLSSTTNISDGLTQASALAKILGNGDTITDAVSIVFDENSKDTGYLVATYAGSGAYLSIKAYSDAAMTTYLPCMYRVDENGDAIDDNGDPVEETANPLAMSTNGQFGYTIAPSSLSYLVRSLYIGTGYNQGTNSNTGQTSGISIEIENHANADSYLVVNSDGIATETYDISLIKGPKFVEDVINLGVENATSDYIKGELFVSGSTNAVTPTPLDSYVDKINNLNITNVNMIDHFGIYTKNKTPRFVKPVGLTTNMKGGTNGTMTAFDGIIGTQAYKSGMYALDDDVLNISIALIPGVENQSVQNALVTLAETSMNFLAVVSPPHGLDTVEEATDWMNGRGHGRTAALNSSWAAVSWPWVQVYSVFDGKDRWYDPAIFSVRQMAFTDNVAETWFAPAGFRRGRLTKPTATEKVLNQGDRDALYHSNINPIVNFNPDGITIFGQKTAQRAPTALDRINVRRLMIYLRKVLLQTGRIDLFEPNDQFTWDEIKTKVELLLSDIQSRRGITDFRVICDSTTNTPLRIDRNELWCKILLKPTKTAEWIIFEVNLTSQAAKFNG